MKHYTNTYEEMVDKYGLIEEYRMGKDEDGDPVMVSIDDTCASIRTFQKNGWVRINVYYKDGTVEELFER